MWSLPSLQSLLVLLLFITVLRAQDDGPPGNFCSGVVQLSNRTGIITDHTGSGNYENNVQCFWVIKPPNPGDWDQVRFELQKLDLEFYFDLVAFYEGELDFTAPNAITWFSGSDLISAASTPIISKTPIVTVIFASDLYVSGDGFRLFYEGVKCPNRCSKNGLCVANQCQCDGGWSGSDCSVKACNSACVAPIGQCINDTCECHTGHYGATCTDPYCHPFQLITASEGSFSDHVNSGLYLNNAYCSWLIDPATQVDSITLTFTLFDLERNFDFVEIYDGSDTKNSDLIGKYTGSELPPSIVSTSGKMLVIFTTDVGLTRLGFDANFTTSNCPNSCSSNGWCLTGSCHCYSGYTTSDCSQSTCVENCSHPLGSCNTSSNTCTCIPGYTGTDCSICTSSAVPSCPNYRCSGVLKRFEGQGRLVDHSGSGNYASDSNCKWIVFPTYSSPVDSIILSFEKFDLNLNKAFLSIKSGVDQNGNGGKLIGRFTGDELPLPIVLFDDSFSVEFFSGKNDVGRSGFILDWENAVCNHSCGGHGICVLQGKCLCDEGWRGDLCDEQFCLNNCSGNGVCVNNVCGCTTGFFGASCRQTHCTGLKTIMASSGVISDHSEGEMYLPNSNCSWLIQTPTIGSTITFGFLDLALDLGYETGAPFQDIISVYDGNSTSSRLLFNISGSFPPPPIITTSSSLFIRFYSDSVMELTGFRALFVENALCPEQCNRRGYCDSEQKCVCFGGFGGATCADREFPSVLQREQKVVGEVDQFGWTFYQINVESDIYMWQAKVQSTGADPSTWELYALMGGLPTQMSYNISDQSDKNVKYLAAKGAQAGAWFIGIRGLVNKTEFTIELEFLCPPDCSGRGECKDFLCICESCFGGLQCEGANETKCGKYSMCEDDHCKCLPGFPGDPPECWIKHNSDSLSGGAIAGIVIIVVLGTIAAGVLCCLLMYLIYLLDKRKRMKRDTVRGRADTVLNSSGFTDVPMDDDVTEMEGIDTNAGTGYSKFF